MIEYLMIYQPSGLPIFSKCFGGFCKAAATDEVLLSGFLSALETFPPTISGGTLKAVDMGETQLIFRKTYPSGISVVVGLTEKADQQVAKEVFHEIQSLIEDKYSHIKWEEIIPEVYEEFRKDLYENALFHVLHKYGGFEDRCPRGVRCLMHTKATDLDKQSIWGRLRGVYNKIRSMMKKNQ
ncbi:MAG: hypothetical protein ACE5R6_01585 [Candidatus Heimdallarchaeota archaeon]